jgi:hypothetical protein
MQESHKNAHREVAGIGAKKGLSATAIHRDLEETLGPEAIAYSTVTKCLRTLSFRGKTEEEEIGNHDQSLDEARQATLKGLADEPCFQCANWHGRRVYPELPVHRHLMYSLGFRVHHLLWVPHRLSLDQKTKRVALSRELLSTRDQEETRGWHNIITLDESWFYLCTDHELIWLAPGERTAHDSISKIDETRCRKGVLRVSAHYSPVNVKGSTGWERRPMIADSSKTLDAKTIFLRNISAHINSDGLCQIERSEAGTFRVCRMWMHSKPKLFVGPRSPCGS